MKLELPGIMICEWDAETMCMIVSPAEGWKVNVNYPISEAHASMVTMEKMEPDYSGIVGKWVMAKRRHTSLVAECVWEKGAWYEIARVRGDGIVVYNLSQDGSKLFLNPDEVFDLNDARDYNPDDRKPHQLKEYDAVECTPDERAEIIRIADECGFDLKYTRIKAFGKSYPNLRFETGDITGIVSRGKCDPKTNWISVPDFIAKIRGEYKENKVNVSEHKHKDIV